MPTTCPSTLTRPGETQLPIDVALDDVAPAAACAATGARPLSAAASAASRTTTNERQRTMTPPVRVRSALRDAEANTSGNATAHFACKTMTATKRPYMSLLHFRIAELGSANGAHGRY